MATITTTNPATGVTEDTGIEATSDTQVASITEAAAGAFSALRSHDRAWRAGLLRALADGLEADRANLTATASAETGLAASPRLDGELTRSAFQLRLFAEAIEEGGYLEAIIDHAGDTPMGPGPDARRMLVPIGPVAVFGSSNFPFAFSVAGGDTASALAAGNPVIVKAHGSHPLTSKASFEALQGAADAYGAPAGTLTAELSTLNVGVTASAAGTSNGQFIVGNGTTLHTNIANIGVGPNATGTIDFVDSFTGAFSATTINFNSQKPCV